jgi:hypothetical protein
VVLVAVAGAHERCWYKSTCFTGTKVLRRGGAAGAVEAEKVADIAGDARLEQVLTCCTVAS